MTGKRRLYMLAALLEPTPVLDRQIVMGGHMDLPPALLQSVHMRQMKLADMAQNGGGIEDFHGFFFSSKTNYSGMRLWIR